MILTTYQGRAEVIFVVFPPLYKVQCMIHLGSSENTSNILTISNGLNVIQNALVPPRF